MEIRWIDGCKNKWDSNNKERLVKPILGIVIHHTGSFTDSSTISWFTEATQNGSNSSASAHYLIGLDGLIYQFVKENARAWHAGVSSLTINGKEYSNWNEFSIGIEITGDGNLKPYRESQYNSLVPLLSLLVNRFNVKKEFVVGHEQIAPKRKTDPGKLFDWERVYHGVYNQLTPGFNSPQNIIYSTGQ